MNAEARIEPERLLTIADAAELTSYDESVIHQWLDRGLTFIAAGTGRVRPRKKDIRIRASVLWQWVRDLEITRPSPTLRESIAPARKTRVATPISSQGLSAWRTVKKGTA